MRKSVLLVVASSALSTVAACGGKLTDAETRETVLPDGAIIGTGGSDNTGGASGSGGNGGSGGTIDPGGTTGSGGSVSTGGGTTGGGTTGGSGGSTTGTGGASGGSGGVGGSGGASVDAGAACPATPPANNIECTSVSLICSYANGANCVCMASGGQGGNRRDAGSAWTCTGSGGGSVDAGGRRG